MQARDGCRLVEVPRSGPLREAVVALRPRPEQEQFSGRAEQTLPLAERDPARHPYAAVLAGEPVGFLVLDETAPAAAPAADLLLRGLFVDAGAQGRGVATAMVALLPALVRVRFPAARTLVLTVDVRNPVARRTYLRGGFVDTGELHLASSAGPQHVLVLDVAAHPTGPAQLCLAQAQEELARQRARPAAPWLPAGRGRPAHRDPAHQTQEEDRAPQAGASGAAELGQ